MHDFIYIEIGFDCTLSFVQNHRGFDGAIRTTAFNVSNGKGFNYNEQENITFGSTGLLIPCDRRATNAIRDFIETQRLMMSADSQEYGHRGPYYFTMTMTRDRAFERAEQKALLFGGPATPYAGEPAFNEIPRAERQGLLRWIFGPYAREVPRGWNENKLNLPMARYNCWTAAHGIVRHVAGIDLSPLSPEMTNAYRAAKASAAFEKMVTDWPAAQRTFFKGGKILHGDNMPPVVAIERNATYLDVMNKKTNRKNETVGAYLARHSAFSSDVQSMNKISAPAP